MAAPLAGVTGVTALAVTGGVLVAAANLMAIVWQPRRHDRATAGRSRERTGTVR
ncbi:hypothetical protein ACFQ0B_71675 [Nonomuraea thailandensis]